MFDSLNRHALGCYGGAIADAEFRSVRRAGADLRQSFRRQPPLHAGAPRPAHRPAEFHASLLGAAGAVRQLDAGAPEEFRRLHASGQRPFPLSSRTAARPITTAIRPGTSCAVRSTTPGRRWLRRRSRVFRARLLSRSITMARTSPTGGSTRSIARSPHRGGSSRTAGLRPRFRIPGRQPRGRRLAAADRVLRSARAVLRAGEIPRRLSDGLRGPILDWPKYGRVKETADEIAEIRANYAALVTMCDAYFGKLLDYFDAHELWKDTALILTTDHGFLLVRARSLGEERDALLRRARTDSAYGPPPRLGRPRRHPHRPCHADARPDADASWSSSAARCRTKFALHRSSRGSIAARTAASSSSACLAARLTPPTPAGDYFLYPPDLDDESLGEYTLMPMHLHSLFTADEMRGAMLASPARLHQGNAGPESAGPDLGQAAAGRNRDALQQLWHRALRRSPPTRGKNTRSMRPRSPPGSPAPSCPNCIVTMPPKTSSAGSALPHPGSRTTKIGREA